MAESDTLPRDLQALVQEHDAPAVLLDTAYRIVAANGAYSERYGSSGPVLGRHCYAVSHHNSRPCDEVGETCPLRASLASGEPRRALHLHYTPQGQEHVDVETRPLRDEQGKIRYVVEIMHPSRAASARPSERGLVGRSPAFNHMLELIERAAPSEAAVLLLGETGTGKEAVAHALHTLSGRADGPFVPVECSGLTETLFESELFGHEKGAFTGAHNRKLGLVEAARGGTLFLDEVGDIPLNMQVKLLRLLESETFRRVGGIEPQKADFRLICATNRDLRELMREGAFREDLYYRISVFPIPLPPLRERREDLPLLVETLLARLVPARSLTVDPRAMDRLRDYDFPGNIRELRNILERAVLLADGERIRTEHLPPELASSGTTPAEVEDTEILPLAEVERRYLERVIARYDGDRKSLAQRLGLSERTLYRKLQALQAGH